MPLRTPQQFVESLRDGREVYLDGGRVEDVTTHPGLRIGVQTCTIDYRLPEEPEHRDLAVVEDPEEGPISRFFHLPRSSGELAVRRDLVEVITQQSCGLVPLAREAGSDGLNALTIITAHIDEREGTDYRSRVDAFRRHCAREDLSLALAMTDVKGDRSRRPHEQVDPDLYLRVVERRSDGIVVRGAKAHITTAPYTNELLVLPTRNMTAEDADYAVAFAVPAATPGLRMIARPVHGAAKDPLDAPVSSRFDFIEALVVFDDVFVPYERVFMLGEWAYAGPLASMFANYHRVTASAYKYATAEIFVGAAQWMAEANGTDGASHIRDKIAGLVLYAETLRALSRSACEHGRIDDLTGLCYPDPIIGNAAKFYFADHYHDVVKAVQDVGGGILVTVPGAAEERNPVTRPWLLKYLAGSPKVAAEERLRVIKLIKDLTASELGGFWEVTTIHAEGSLAAERMAALREADMERYRRAARRAAGLEAREG